jgi:hypothetical protein
VNDNGVLCDSDFKAGALIGLCEEGHACPRDLAVGVEGNMGICIKPSWADYLD